MKTIKKYKHFLPVVVYGIFYLKCFKFGVTICHINSHYRKCSQNQAYSQKKQRWLYCNL